MNDKVMVVTPTYCTAENKRLPMLLQSIYWVSKQTYNNLTHVIVDDGSMDETPELLEEIAFHNPHIKVYHKQNGGSSSAVNFGVEQEISKNKYSHITITHSDDLLPINSIEDRVNSSIENDSKFVYSDMIYYLVPKNMVVLKKAPTIDNPAEFYDALKNQVHITFPTMIWTADFFTDKLNGYDIRLTHAEDMDIALRSAGELAKTNNKHSVVNKVTAAYRSHYDNITHAPNNKRMLWGAYKILLKKHLSGSEYQLGMAKAGLRLAKSMRSILPETVRKPLRFARDKILSKPPTILPYKSEFIESLDTINYKNALLSKK